ncbi:glycoside hydrolase family 3 N-terminal domain-containing protein [Glaciecola siphonariae]|uniref:Glycoside hydrolase family 3 N-terminal domain-containing protein n=1 Tax=Glaciecola siphonariae TaxID=521012 RepID=A0ABV9LU11_9ALTE
MIANVLRFTIIFAVLGGLLASPLIKVHADSAANSEISKSLSSAAHTENDVSIWPVLEVDIDKNEALEQTVAQLLSTMTLEQKIAQMIQPEIRDITPEDMRKYGFGSYLNGGGSFPNGNKHASAHDWIKLAEQMYQASVDNSLDGSSIPTMWGTDAVHGHNNVIGATLFPHNIGLGAMQNPELIEQIAQVTAAEVMVTGIDWVFAPTVAVVRDDRWGRTYESYSENPEIVKTYAASIVRGLQGRPGIDFLNDERVISTVKHFVGDGGTVAGDDQGDNVANEKALYEIHAQGYVGGLTAGAQSVMASFNSWHGEKLHGHRYLLTEVLKERMGFDGFVVGDWNGHGQIKGCSEQDCAQAANAGLDIYMVPTGAWKPLYYNLIEQVNNGVIPLSRIDDAVTRILRVKVRAGLFNKPSPAKRALSGKTNVIGQTSHRDIARQAVRESLVLLKNRNQLLPLSPSQRVLVAGDGADNIGKQSGGWTITWQGTNNTNDDFPGGTSILDGIQEQVERGQGSVSYSIDGQYTEKPDVAIVVFGENPYAEGHGDREHLDYQHGEKSDLALLKRLKSAGIPVVSIFLSGRPMWVNAELNASDAFVAAWLPGSEGAAIASVLFTDPSNRVQHDFKGKLPFSWPKSAHQAAVNVGDTHYDPLLPYGFGLRYGDSDMLAYDLDEDNHDTSDIEQGLALFSGALKAPWQFELVSGSTTSKVVSNTASLASVDYRTIDKTIQEDAILLSAERSEQLQGIQITSSNNMPKEGMSLSAEANYQLSFLLKLDSSIPERLMLGMGCRANQSINSAEDSCMAAVDIAPLLSRHLTGKWESFAVDVNCFTQQGVMTSALTMPFQLLSKNAFNLSLSDIRFEPSSSNTTSLQCE